MSKKKNLKDKEIRLFITLGIESLNISQEILNTLFLESIKYYDNSTYFIAFDKSLHGIKVLNNSTLITTLEHLDIPTNIWFILEEQQDFILGTFLLPSEY